jgi:hypothetical protein
MLFNSRSFLAPSPLAGLTRDIPDILWSRFPASYRMHSVYPCSESGSRGIIAAESLVSLVHPSSLSIWILETSLCIPLNQRPSVLFRPRPGTSRRSKHKSASAVPPCFGGGGAVFRQNLNVQQVYWMKGNNKHTIPRRSRFLLLGEMRKGPRALAR